MTVAVQGAKCFVCGHFEHEYKTKGLWVGGKWYCPNCVRRLSDRKPTDLGYRPECFKPCPHYRVNMYGGLSLPDEPENPRYICLKFQANEQCIYDEPQPVKVKTPTPPTAPAHGQTGSWWTTTFTAITLATQQPKPPESLPPKPEPVSLIGPASNLPARPRLESPAPKRKPQPRRQRRQT